ncbi:hypothetical protein E4U21_006889, partial [Claviceps maximensis]
MAHLTSIQHAALHRRAMRPWHPRRPVRRDSRLIAATRAVQSRRLLSQTTSARSRAHDARVRDIVGREIKDEYAYIREHY